MKKYLAFALAVIFIVTSVSCSSYTPSCNGDGSTKSTLKNSNSKELSIYILDYDTTAQKAVEKFNAGHKGVKIKATSVPAAADELRSKLMYGLNNGEGPDLILCEENTMPNLSVFFGKGSFYDLNSLIKADKSFKWSDYIEKAMDFGIFNEKRYVIPLSFKIDAMYSTKELLEEGGVDIDKQISVIDKFADAAKQFTASNSREKKFFFSLLDFGSLIQTSAKPFYDLEKKTADFGSKGFGDLLDKYKALADSASTKVLSVAAAQKNDLLSGGKVLLLNKGTFGPRYAALPYDSFVSEMEPVLLTSPSNDAEPHIIARPEKYIGINSKCGNVQAAYDFIKLMLSKDFQDVDMMEGIPVNRDAYEQAKDNSLKGMKGYDSWKSSGCCTEKALKKLYSQFDKLIEGVDRCWTTDGYVLTLIENEVRTYVAGNSKKEDTVKNIQAKVENYFKSGFVMEIKNAEDEDAPVDPMKTLTLYYWDPDCYINHSKRIFEEENPGLKVKIKEFTSFGDYQTATAVELMAGGGPDIVTLHLRSFTSINKVVNSGVFCEMDEYISKYDVVKFDECNNKLLDGGVYNGKRYYIPLHYYSSLLHSTKKWLNENNIKIDENNWTWDKFVAYSKAFVNKAENKNKYFLSANYGLYQMLVNWEEPLIEYEKRKSNFNSDSFKKLLHTYKELLPSIAPEGYRSKKGYAFSWGLDGSREYKIASDDYKQLDWGDITLVPTPSLSGKQIYNAVLDEGMAVNSKCKNKEAAFKFIKIAASYDMQRYYYKDGNPNGNISIPVNNKAFGDDLKEYMNSSANSLSKDLVDQAIHVHNTIGYCQIKDFNIIEMIEEMAKDYIDGKKSADQVAQEIDDKVNVYLNE